MKSKKWMSFAAFISFFVPRLLVSHCQMPCGIYHDDMVYDRVDQYIETMVKGDSILNKSQFETPQQRNEFIRWVMNKDRMSDETAELILTYFLQQKIKPGEDDTVERLVSAHKLLFLLVQIKQTADVKIVKEFYDEWEKFKLMFHIEGYECKLEEIKLKQRAEKEKALKEREFIQEARQEEYDEE